MTRKNWLRVGTYGTLAVIVTFFLANPYTRQTVFGPRIQGMPFAYWQDCYREAALGEHDQSLAAQALAFIGVRHSTGWGDCPAQGEILTVALSLVDDSSPEVRAHIAQCIGQNFDSREACDALVRLLDDPSPLV